MKPDPARLASIVRAEAERRHAESSMRPNPERVAEGWEHRFVIEAVRVADLVRLYEEAGFEVLVEAVEPEQIDPDCADCRLMAALEFRAVYTRPRSGSPGGVKPGTTGPPGSSAPAR
jgi:hypothetical protein